jgi:hypothetical protein
MLVGSKTVWLGVSDNFVGESASRGIEIQPADIVRLAIEIGIVAVEPILTAMRIQIGFGQDTSNGTAAHVAVMGFAENLKRQIIESSVGIGLLLIGRLATGQCDDSQPFLWGKSCGVGRSEEHLGDQPDPVSRSFPPLVPEESFLFIRSGHTIGQDDVSEYPP